MSRKRNLVDHGFRLPSAMDNRPLRWEEPTGSADDHPRDPGTRARQGGHRRPVQQIIRPTG